jgi:cysteine protease ATG4
MYTGTGTGMDKGRQGSTHGHDVLISPPSRENLRDIQSSSFASSSMSATSTAESASLLDSQLTEMPSKAFDADKKEKKSRGRGLVKKTSKLFLRGDKDKTDPSHSASLAPRPSERQSSYSSATSTDSTLTSSSNGSMPMASVTAGRPPAISGHSRRLSHDSQYSWQGGQSVRSGISTSTTQATGLESRRMSSNNSNNLSASVPALSRNSLPQPGPNSRVGQQETIPSRMSSWFTNLLPSTSSATIFESPANPEQQAASSSPARKGPSAAASFLYAARQKAVDGVRNLLDTEAQPDKSPDTIWVMGVAHPGYRPSSPLDSPASSSVDLPIDGPSRSQAQRRSSSSSTGTGTGIGIASPSFKSDQAALRPAVWPKKKDTPQGTTSPPPKGIGNLFSPSSLTLALPTTSSPSKDAGQIDSPSKGKKKEREVIRWPEQCKSGNLSLSPRILIK